MFGTVACNKLDLNLNHEYLSSRRERQTRANRGEGVVWGEGKLKDSHVITLWLAGAARSLHIKIAEFCNAS